MRSDEAVVCLPTNEIALREVKVAVRSRSAK
jgi:hypothetical protein